MSDPQTFTPAEAPDWPETNPLLRSIRRLSPKRWANAKAASLARRLSMWAARDCNLLSYARNELNDPSKIDHASGREMEAMINSAILELVAVHSNENHSGSSHSYALARARRLLDFKPLGPLTGCADEWTKCSHLDEEKTVFQNRRCSSVFKNVESDGTEWAEETNFFVFREPDGSTFTSYWSRVVIGFPYAVRDPVVLDVWDDSDQQHRLIVNDWLESNDVEGVISAPEPR